MRYHSYLHTAVGIISRYRGEEPLNSFLKKFFSGQKKFGSTDRRQISSLCYQYFRPGKALLQLDTEERILAAHFLCIAESSDFLAFHRPEWNLHCKAALTEKMAIAGLHFSIEEIFPRKDALSEGIDAAALAASMLQQPLVFGRIRPGKEAIVKQQLLAAGINYAMPAPGCISVESATKLDVLLHLNKDLVIQDLNSQQVLQYLGTVPHKLAGAEVWDCCAASGGKSLLLYDRAEGNLRLTVSDIRPSILANLGKRFAAAGIRQYHSFLANLEEDTAPLPPGAFDIIICDAPCTGSGTWARTPEQLYYFDSSRLPAFTTRQQQIATHVLPRLRKGGLFFYITCSVFKSENEDVVDYLTKKFHLQVLQMESLKGYGLRADNMFVAVLTA